MSNKDYKPFAVFCSCRYPEHTLQAYPDDGEVVLTLSLNKPTLWTRLKYLFGLWPWSGYAETVLDKDNIEDLEKIINYLKEGTENVSKE